MVLKDFEQILENLQLKVDALKYEADVILPVVEEQTVGDACSYTISLLKY